MRTILASIVFVVVTAAGCGGKGKSETTADPCQDPCKDQAMEGHDGEGGEQHAEHALTPELEAFHDLLKPIWHADATPARDASACDESGRMLDLGASIQNTSGPEGVDGTMWDDGVRELLLSVTRLQDSCPGRVPGPDTDAALAAVHEAFHSLIQLVPAT